jgi:hypothetical protein
VKLFSPAHQCQRFGRLSASISILTYPENGGSRFLRSMRNNLPNYTSLRHRIFTLISVKTSHLSHRTKLQFLISQTKSLFAVANPKHCVVTSGAPRVSITRCGRTVAVVRFPGSIKGNLCGISCLRRHSQQLIVMGTSTVGGELNCKRPLCKQRL